jgi:hypothetical protein
MWGHVDLVWTDVLGERIASIFRVENPQVRNQHEQVAEDWRWRRYIPPKHRFTQDLHSATSQKTAFFIVTAMESSDLKKIKLTNIQSTFVKQGVWILRFNNKLVSEFYTFDIRSLHISRSDIFCKSDNLASSRWTSYTNVSRVNSWWYKWSKPCSHKSISCSKSKYPLIMAL